MARPAAAFRCFIFAKNNLLGRSCPAVTQQAQCYATGRASQAPSKPKRPLSAFFVYRGNVFRDVQAQNPGMRLASLSKLIAQQYRELPEDAKQDLQRQSLANREAYKKQKQEFQASLTPSQKEQLSAETKAKAQNKKKRQTRKLNRQLEKPRRGASSGFMAFIQSKALDRGEAPQTEFVKGASRVWQRMPEQEKQVYMEQARLNRMTYEEALTRWEQQMLKQGITSVVRVKNRPKPEKPKKVARAKKPKKKASGKAVKKTASGKAAKKTVSKKKTTTTIKITKRKEE